MPKLALLLGKISILTLGNILGLAKKKLAFVDTKSQKSALKFPLKYFAGLIREEIDALTSDLIYKKSTPA